MELSDELAAAAEAASAFADSDETVTAVLAAEATPGDRVYLCAFTHADGRRSWLALDADDAPVTGRDRVRAAASIAATVEIAEEHAGGGELEELRQTLAGLRLTENPTGIDEAEEAALAVEHTIASPPRLATPAYLDELGAATRRLEQALGGSSNSPFAVSVHQSLGAVDELANEIETTYKLPLA